MALSPQPLTQAQVDAVVAALQQGRWDEALARVAPLAAAHPQVAVLHTLAGVALTETGRLDEAEAAHARAAALSPQDADPHYNLGTVRHRLGRTVEAELAYRAAIARRPAHAHALNNLAALLKERQAFAEAVPLLERALVAEPGHLDAALNLGDALLALDRPAEAAMAFRHAADLAPDLVECWRPLADTLATLGQSLPAAEAWQQVLRLAPDDADAALQLGNILTLAGRYADAAEAYRAALAVRPEWPGVLGNLGAALEEQGELGEALAAYDRCLAIEPGYQRAIGNRLHLLQKMGNFAAPAEFAAVADVLGLGEEPISPFTLLALEDNPARQRARTAVYARLSLPPETRRSFAVPATRPARLRVGYVSADFHDHATMVLMAGVFRCHDRARFEIVAYSHGPDSAGPARRDLLRRVDRFVDIRGLSDGDAAALMREQGIDLAVDLKGYTLGQRTGIFAHRAAPVQVSWLGYPGTLGAPWMDYIVVDPVVIAPDQRAHIDEALIVLPHCYQPNDDQRAFADTTTTRADHGLPQDGFVFCSFNGTWKIGGDEFAVWLDLLARVPDAVLWLFRANRWAEAALRAAARDAGVDPERLVFAAYAPHAEHLARLRHADLVLDTFFYNAHTTASDALWAGVPLVTLCGRGFPARVAASLLQAVGLPELVTHTRADYAALALALAQDRPRLAALKQRLEAQHASAPLFDTTGFTRHLEAGFEAAWQRFAAGLPPADLVVPA